MDYLITILISTIIVGTWVIVQLILEKRTVERQNKELHEKNIELIALVHMYQADELQPETSESIENDPAESIFQIDDLSEEEHHRQVGLMAQVKTICKVAEFHLDHLEDEFQLSRLRKKYGLALEITNNIQDDFYRNSALHSLIRICARAGWKQETFELLRSVNDELIKEVILEEIGAEYS